MQFLSIKRSLFFGFFLIGGAVFAQDQLGSETVTVIKPYTPSVGDANKIRQSPAESDSVRLEKKPVQYNIFSVPVASTFTPAKGRATTVERARPVKVFDNYARLGFGNYSNVLAEFYSNLEVNRTDNFGVFLNHNSSQGGIEGVRLDDKFYDTELNLNYNSRNRDFSWKTEVGLEHRLFNWYGLPDDLLLSEQEIAAIDPPQQNYLSAFVGGEIEMYDSFFDKAELQFRHSGDSHGSSENHFDASGTFELNIADELITTSLMADIVNGQFDQLFFNQGQVDYTFLNFGINPSLLILRDDLTVDLGVAFYYSLDAENSDNNFNLYPRISASYRLAGDYFTAYASIEGELEQNTYYQFFQQNPYVSPSLNIMPTNKEYDAYLGGKGKFDNNISYNIRAGYASEFNKALFRRNPVANSLVNEDYAYGNSFEVVYDDVTTLSLFGELNVDINRDFRMGVNAEYFNYSTDEQREAWNLPDFKASLNADYQISETWYTGANFLFRGERKDVHYSAGMEMTDLTPLTVVSLDSYLDLNAHLGYRFNNQLSAFVRGNNLLNNTYERWTNFQVQGLQVLAGATYKFDF